MCELWWIKAEHLVKNQVFWRRWKPFLTFVKHGYTYFSSNHMRNAHQVIINNISEVIGRKPIILNNHLIVHYSVFKYHLAMHNVFELRFALWNLHANDIRFALSLLFSYLVCIVTLSTKAIVHRLCVFLTTNLHPHLCQTLSSAKTRVGIAVL